MTTNTNTVRMFKMKQQAGMAPICTECTDLDLAVDCTECIKEGIGRTILMNSLSICTANTSTRK